MGKYDHIDFKPPESAANAAERGLELRKKNKGKGGLSSQQAKSEGVGSGVQRAVNLKNRTKLSPSTVRRMKAFFDRHQKSRNVDKGKTHGNDKGYIAWMLWGGNPGYSWAKKIVNQMDAADKKSKAEIINRIVKIANDLDQKELFDEANELDSMAKDFLSGGLGDDLEPEDVDPKQLEMGKKVEMEHTDNPEIAEEISLDHLAELEDYYDRLSEMEEGAKRGKTMVFLSKLAETFSDIGINFTAVDLKKIYELEYKLSQFSLRDPEGLWVLKAIERWKEELSSLLKKGLFAMREIFQWWINLHNLDEIDLPPKGVIETYKQLSRGSSGDIGADMVLFWTALDTAQPGGPMANHLVDKTGITKGLMDDLSGGKYVEEWNKEIFKYKAPNIKADSKKMIGG